MFRKKDLKGHSKNVVEQSKNNIENDAHCLVTSLEANIELFTKIFNNDETLVVRRFQNKYLKEAKCCAVYIAGMVNTDMLNENVIQPILQNNLREDIYTHKLLEELQYKIIVSDNVNLVNDLSELVNSVISGDTILLLEGYDNALIISTRGWPTRSIEEPESAKVVRGPREGFTESLMTSLSLIRRKINTPELKFKFREMGERTHTKVCVCYIEGLAVEEILLELEKRLDAIKIDAILDSGYIQELIRDAPFSPYETVGYSERPDVIAAKLLEGRIAIVVDGSPFVLTVPFVLAESFQSDEDYYNNFIFSSFNRMIRMVGVFVATGLPAVYLAIVTYHQEMLPTPLLISIASARQGVPFPSVVALFFMLLVFDVIREAATRMPTPIGQAVNIVGTLVLGQAIVEAKIVSSPVIIITAISGIMKLLSPTALGSIIVLRLFFLLLASVMGIYGYILGMIIATLHLMNVRSFGVPYMLGLSSVKNHNGQDIWIRAPWWTMTLRPKIIGARNLVRQSMKKTVGSKPK
ncbi:spore germination protein [Neobacillus sp. PS3-40]|uniref:spore germination protein n=1 Tax=Neobacillus sp. PS3-40 TaxID=3070679 RepID=UPI0027E11222|nr:spore germination protein [Neobacillus sp. PS3-40]WML44758.1 spore germination protein [Neobacillus sp. PS3-40]